MKILRRIRSRTVMAGWLLAVWLLLWGRVDAATVLSGIAVAYGAFAATRLPVVPLIKGLRPLGLAAAALEFSWDLFASSLVIGMHALRRPGRVNGAIVNVRARTNSDVVMLAVTTSMSLRPGTLVLDIDWDRSWFVIHGMPVGTAADAESIKSGLFSTERRIVHAFGGPADTTEPREPT